MPDFDDREFREASDGMRIVAAPSQLHVGEATANANTNCWHGWPHSTRTIPPGPRSATSW